MTGLLEKMQAHLAELEQRVFALEAKNKVLKEVVVDPAQQDIMGDGAEAVTSASDPLKKNYKAPEQFSYAAAHIAFPKLKSIVGNKLATSNWEMWHRLILKHGWRCILKAAENIDPLKRWPDSVEQLIKEQPSEYRDV